MGLDWSMGCLPVSEMPKKTIFPLESHHPCFLSQGWGPLSPLLRLARVLGDLTLHRSYTDNLFAEVSAVALSSCVQQRCHAHQTALHSVLPHPPALLCFPLPLPRCLGGGQDVDIFPLMCIDINI